MGAGTCGRRLTSGTRAPWVNWVPLPHASRGAHSGERGPATQGAVTWWVCPMDVTLSPWVRGREQTEAWMEVGADVRVLPLRLVSHRCRPAWALWGALSLLPGNSSFALTQNQPRA